MKKNKFVYKVVEYDRIHDEYTSINTAVYGKAHIPKTMQLTYKLDEKTAPVVGKLFCFKTLTAARAYGSISSSSRILKGKATGIEEAKGVIASPRAFENFQLAWTEPSKLVNSKLSWPIPEGTYFATSFIPTKEV